MPPLGSSRWVHNYWFRTPTRRVFFSFLPLPLSLSLSLSFYLSLLHFYVNDSFCYERTPMLRKLDSNQFFILLGSRERSELLKNFLRVACFFFLPFPMQLLRRVAEKLKWFDLESKMYRYTGQIVLTEKSERKLNCHYVACVCAGSRFESETFYSFRNTNINTWEVSFSTKKWSEKNWSTTWPMILVSYIV